MLTVHCSLSGRFHEDSLSSLSDVAASEEKVNITVVIVFVVRDVMTVKVGAR